MRQPKIGDHVIYHEPDGTARHALVTCIFDGRDAAPLVNVTFVSGDEKRQDVYGRQSERATSTIHKSESTVHGCYWRWPDEEPNPVVAPSAK